MCIDDGGDDGSTDGYDLSGVGNTDNNDSDGNSDGKDDEFI